MVKEVDWQTKIRQRIEKEGGYAKKWATAYAVGVPDLVTVVKGVTVFVEVKLEKDLPADGKTWERSIKLRPKQKVELERMADAGAKAMVIVVCYHNPREVYFCFKHRGTWNKAGNGPNHIAHTVRWSDQLDLSTSIKEFVEKCL